MAGRLFTAALSLFMTIALTVDPAVPQIRGRGPAVFKRKIRKGSLGRGTQKPDWREKGPREARALLAAMDEGKIEQLREWMDEGFEIDELYRRGNFMMPPLSIAMESRGTIAARFLLDEGADIDRMSQVTITDRELDREETIDVFTPLMHAALEANNKGAVFLIESGADIDAAGAGGVTALIVAAESNAAETVRALLEAGASIDGQLEDKDVVENLDKGGRRLMPVGAGRATALWVAARSGNSGVVKFLLEAGADRDLEAYCAGEREALSGEESCTAARVAELKGHHELAALIGGEEDGEAKAASSAESTFTVSMGTAAERKDLFLRVTEVMDDDDVGKFRLYLKGGLEIDAALGSEWNLTLLSMAIREEAVGIVGLLIEEGADVNRMTKASAGREKDPRTGKKAPRRVVDLRSPLMDAVRKSCVECIDLLLGAGADIATVGYQGYTVLHFAVDKGSRVRGKADLVRRLIEEGADVDGALEIEKSTHPPKVNGATPLWMAAWFGDNRVIRILYEAGADIDVEADCRKQRGAGIDEETCTVRRIAELREKEETVALIDELTGAAPAPPVEGDELTAALLDGNVKRSELLMKLRSLVRKGDVKSLGVLLDEGLDADKRVDMGGFVPLLSLAVLAKSNDVVRLLLDRGADPDLMSLNRSSSAIANTGFVTASYQKRKNDDIPDSYIPVFSPLMYGSFKGNEEAVGLLLEAGADVNAVGLAGMTALMAAAGRNHPAIVGKLIDGGGDLDARIDNSEGRRYREADGATALWLAAFSGAAEAAATLLQAGADPSLEAECRSRLAPAGEETCDCRRIAELREHRAVTKVIDAALKPGAASGP